MIAVKVGEYTERPRSAAGYWAANCAKTCEECFGECVHMDMPGLAKCIQLCRDCADVCVTDAQVMARGSEFNICQSCAEICDACA